MPRTVSDWVRLATSVTMLIRVSDRVRPVMSGTMLHTGISSPNGDFFDLLMNWGEHGIWASGKGRRGFLVGLDKNEIPAVRLFPLFPLSSPSPPVIDYNLACHAKQKGF